MRTLPSSRAICGMTLRVSPALNLHTEITADSSGATRHGK
jgi:hypothetical protein